MKKLLVGLWLFVLLLSVGSFMTAPVAHAAWNPFNNKNSESVCQKAGTGNSSVCATNGSDPITGTNGVLVKVTRLIATIAGVIAVIIMITGGIMYITSNGDPGKITTAKNTLIYAAVGLVIIALAQTLIVFVINRVAP
jgi:hypothetical protein